jgi:response regulator RpfG family c-di-GMP phosphodiesterase
MGTAAELKALMETGKRQAKELNDLEDQLSDTMTAIRTMGAEILEKSDGETRREVMRALWDMMKFGLELRMERAMKEDERAQAFELLRSAGKNTGLA